VMALARTTGDMPVLTCVKHFSIYRVFSALPLVSTSECHCYPCFTCITICKTLKLILKSFIFLKCFNTATCISMYGHNEVLTVVRWELLRFV
jgi:hypothetical protein